MNKQNSIIFSNGDIFHPGISVDCVVFGFHEGKLKILLNKYHNYELPMLPGGFVLKDENVDAAAYRTLQTRTGLNNIYLRQFYLFGDCDRVNKAQNEDILKRLGDNTNNEQHWFLNRFISVGYYAFVEYSKVKLHVTEIEETAWFNYDDIPLLYVDHNKIISKAISVIRSQIGSIPIGYELLPCKFTMTELRIIYETILGEKLDRRNFQRKILSTGLLHKLDEVSRKKGVKDTSLFSFDDEKYNTMLTKGLPFF